MKLLLFFIGLFLSCNTNAQTLKEEALEAFKIEDYPKAISLLKKAAIETPNDAEVYYYLGFFMHYNAYDSRPLVGYNYNYSTEIFNYLKKAIELKPDYGDAKYFYGVECSANYFISMQHYDATKLKMYAQKAFDIGAYPPWLVEWGRNFLNQLEPDAIVFTGGNADFDICTYLQLCQKFRTDVTIIPVGNIDRPWYVAFLKKGLKGAVRNINITLTDEQISDIHPFKWRAVTQKLSVSDEQKKKYDLPSNYTMDWLLEPDLTSDRIHSKIASDSAIKRSYLSPQRAILLHIVEQNNWQRPIYFSNGSVPFFLGGLDYYTQNCGLVSKLLPLKTANTKYDFDYNAMTKLLSDSNLKNYRDIVKNDIPRISGSTVLMYHRIFINLASHYKAADKTRLTSLVTLYKKYLQVGFDHQYEVAVLKDIEK